MREHTAEELARIPVLRPASELTAGTAGHDEEATMPAATTTTTPEEWPDPVPLAQADEVLPEWPADFFDRAPWVRDMVEAVAASVQCPTAYSAFGVLGALSTALAGKVALRSRQYGETPLLLQIVFAADPGSGKSRALDLTAEHPVNCFLRDLAEASADEIGKQGPTIEVLTKKRKECLAKIDKVEGKKAVDQLIEELAEMDAAIAAAQEPIVPQIQAEDSTVEALAQLMLTHGPVSVVSGESAFLEVASGRRYKGSGSLDLVKKAWSGEPMRIDRKGGADGGRRSFTLRRPLLTLCIASQPRSIAELGSYSRAIVHGGLYSRWLCAVPGDHIGHRLPPSQAPPVPADVRARYVKNVKALLGLPVESRDRTQYHIELSGAAWAELDAMASHFEPRLADGQDLAESRDWSSRLLEHATRLAGLLHVAEHAELEGEDGHRFAWLARQVSGETMRRAVRLVSEFWLPHAVAFGRLLTETNRTRAQVTTPQMVLEWLAREQAKKGRDEVRRWQVEKSVRACRGDACAAQDALDLLADWGWLAAGPVGGYDSRFKRPVPKAYNLHPRLAELIEEVQP